MNFNYLILPILIVFASILVAGVSLRRMLGRLSQYAKWRKIAERIVLSAVILVTIAVCLSTAFNAFVSNYYWANTRVPGSTYSIDGHKMHLYCTGSGSPTIVLDAGLGNDWLIWSKVQPELSKTTRVCSYDRAGFGWSESQPAPRDANTIADELHKLLSQGGITDPIILMGHSIAGVYIRAYATRYPQALSGLIFVDGTTPLQEEHGVFKAAAEKAPSPAVGFALMRAAFIVGVPRLIGQCKVISGFDAQLGKMLAEDLCRPRVGAMALEVKSIKQSGEETVNSGPFGRLPILIFSQDPEHPLPPQLSPVTAKQLTAEWNQLQENLKRLSTRSVRIIAKGSSHYVQLDRADLINKEVPVFVEQIRGKREPRTDFGLTVTE
jgi:pimeloyl-ACP methyl ester carboxylesterase